MKIHFLPSQSDFRQQIERGAKGGQTDWTCPKHAEIGELTFFIVLGEGVLATGLVASTPKPVPKSWESFHGRYHARIKNVQLLAAPVPMVSLIRSFPNWRYPNYPRSYATVESPLAEKIVDFIARTDSVIVDDSFHSSVIVEGTPRTTSVVQYERSKKARERCLEHWGYSCVVCGIEFGEIYGPDFMNFIHVHHVEPVASKKKAYRLSPVRDMRPICPNCHAVAHRSEPPFSVADIKRFMKEAKNSKT
jgi:predicted HNH restriction endonuclease